MALMDEYAHHVYGALLHCDVTPSIPYWVVPGAIGFPLTLRALVIYRRMNRGSWKAPSNSGGEETTCNPSMCDEP